MRRLRLIEGWHPADASELERDLAVSFPAMRDPTLQHLIFVEFTENPRWRDLHEMSALVIRTDDLRRRTEYEIELAAGLPRDVTEGWAGGRLFLHRRDFGYPFVLDGDRAAVTAALDALAHLQETVCPVPAEGAE